MKMFFSMILIVSFRFSVFLLFWLLSYSITSLMSMSSFSLAFSPTALMKPNTLFLL